MFFFVFNDSVVCMVFCVYVSCTNSGRTFIVLVIPPPPPPSVADWVGGASLRRPHFPPEALSAMLCVHSPNLETTLATDSCQSEQYKYNSTSYPVLVSSLSLSPADPQGESVTWCRNPGVRVPLVVTNLSSDLLYPIASQTSSIHLVRIQLQFVSHCHSTCCVVI